MTQGAGDQIRKPNTLGVDVNDAGEEVEALSLLGESGREVAENVARIALGKLTVAELRDPRYRLARDGALSLEIDGESFEAVQQIVSR